MAVLPKSGTCTSRWKCSEENQQLRERNQALEAEVQDLKQGLGAIEERAREELGMIKEGETFYQIIEEPVATDEQQ